MREEQDDKFNEETKSDNEDCIKTRKITSAFATFDFKLLRYILFDYIDKRKRFTNDKKKLYEVFTI